MGTKDDSRVRKARKLFRCCSCRLSIEPGTRYLDYRIGLMDSVRVHLKCAQREKYDSGQLVYSCDALDAEMTGESL